eukprot:TRINITY_DN9791_c0_g1_i7.p1 TRINITY_DN9791_c0_g1~~TRINITY_DN9791_c0_g1_i7.p1  ORF type:complete len:464 (-),score=90.30 TRINITY_DN9791_c0_g1_i7:463-1854(-)
MCIRDSNDTIPPLDSVHDHMSLPTADNPHLQIQEGDDDDDEDNGGAASPSHSALISRAGSTVSGAWLRRKSSCVGSPGGGSSGGWGASMTDQQDGRGSPVYFVGRQPSWREALPPSSNTNPAERTPSFRFSSSGSPRSLRRGQSFGGGNFPIDTTNTTNSEQQQHRNQLSAYTAVHRNEPLFVPDHLQGRSSPLHLSGSLRTASFSGGTAPQHQHQHHQGPANMTTASPSSIPPSPYTGIGASSSLNGSFPPPKATNNSASSYTNAPSNSSVVTDPSASSLNAANHPTATATTSTTTTTAAAASTSNTQRLSTSENSTMSQEHSPGSGSILLAEKPPLHHTTSTTTTNNNNSYTATSSNSPKESNHTLAAINSRGTYLGSTSTAPTSGITTPLGADSVPGLHRPPIVGISTSAWVAPTTASLLLRGTSEEEGMMMLMSPNSPDSRDATGTPTNSSHPPNQEPH